VVRAFPMSILTNRARHFGKPYAYENITVCFSLCDRATFATIMSFHSRLPNWRGRWSGPSVGSVNSAIIVNICHDLRSLFPIGAFDAGHRRRHVFLFDTL
jgi:hypothetical protein